MTAPAGRPSEHHWPFRTLVRDYLLAAAGLAVCFPPLLYTEWTASVVIILGGLSALFAWLAGRTLMRQRAVVRLDDDAIARDRRKIAWREITAVTLRRYGGKREAKDGGGVMELGISGGTTRIGVDSRITDFLPLARRVYSAARKNGAAMDEKTRVAFAALGCAS